MSIGKRIRTGLLFKHTKKRSLNSISFPEQRLTARRDAVILMDFIVISCGRKAIVVYNFGFSLMTLR